MNTSNYHLLSAPARRAARKLAKELVQSVPAVQPEIETGSLRGILASSYMRAKNVFAAFTFPDDNAWHAAVVLQKASKLVELNWSPPNGLPYQQALVELRHCIAAVKGTREHPAVQQFRDAGIEPDQLEILDVYHPTFGCRCFLMTAQEIEVQANQYAAFLKENKIRFGQQCLVFAEEIVLDKSPQLPANEHFFLWSDDLGAHQPLAFHAAGFLLKNGVELICDDEHCPDEYPGVPFNFDDVRRAFSASRGQL